MKKLIFALALLACQTVFAQEMPVCVDENSESEVEVVAPCRYSQHEANTFVIDMMLENAEGLKLIRRTGDAGLMLDIFAEVLTNKV